MLKGLKSNWLSKIVSLMIAIGVWFTIFSHLNKNNKLTPVPGTDQIPIPVTPSETNTPPNPLIPPPVPGGN